MKQNVQANKFRITCLFLRRQGRWCLLQREEQKNSRTLPLINHLDRSFWLHPLMICRRAKRNACVTSARGLFSQLIKCHWLEDFSNTIDSQCTILQQFRSNGLGEVTKKRKKRFNRSRRRLWLLKKSRMLGEPSLTLGFSSTTKTWLTLKKSKCLGCIN